ncbi:MAG: hypothetical protein H7175_02680, partial [Burkholderiales bacterium]|nr:hypothetical protein [Anaerolineae bacterium]
SPDGWRVAWSTMDIFDVLVSGSRITVDADRQPRANILDRNGNVLVEQGGTVITLYAIRQTIPNEADCAVLLGDVLQKQPDDILAFFAPYAAETLFYVGEVDPETERQYDAQLTELCNITANLRIERQTRRYVGHGAASHVTGYISTIPADQLETFLSQGYRESDLVGLAGIEQAYDDVLGGQASQTLRIVESGGVPLRELAGAEGIEPQPITLTIDRDLQMATARAISDAYNYAQTSWGSLSPGTGVVVIDVNTGAILALASYPTFEPAIFNPDTPFPFVGDYITQLATDEMRPLTNRVVSEQFAPGSVFKVVTTAAAASENIFQPDEIFSCGLEWDGTPYGDTFGVRTDWRHTDGLEATGDITISQALTSSCDPFFYQAGAMLYAKEPGLVVEYAQRFGLGRRSGLDILGPEASGNVPMPDSAASAINNAIGQGDTQLTVIQTAMMTAAVANGGTVYSPYIVERVGDEQVGQPTAIGDVGLSQEVMDIVRRGMCDVIADRVRGTAQFVFPEAETNYTVCGKTGTAQTAQREPHAWFLAYAPAENPEIAVVVVSQNSREGSEVAAPIARRILDNYFGQPFFAFPEWWTEEYHPMNIPAGGTGGG